MSLSFNPEGHRVVDGRSLAEIIADEEYLEAEEAPVKPVKPVKKEKDEKKFKCLSFELDMTYPRTLRGFFRILQILLLLVAFICLVITPWVEAQGVYSFYCVVLVFGALISGFLFFTIIAGSRKSKFCGLTWVKVELLYFALFGLIIFIGACLAASNNSTGNAGLSAGVAFGFIACITFAVYIFWTWKEYKNPPEDEEEKKHDEESGENSENKETESQKDNEWFTDEGNGPKIVAGTNDSRRSGSLIDPPTNENGDLRIDAPASNKRQNGNFGEHHGYRANDGTRSLERPLSIISRNELIDPAYRKDQHNRRHRSGSDNDSAYSEGSIIDKDRSLPAKMRRTASSRMDDRNRHSTRRPRNGGEKRIVNGSAERRPQQLSATNLLAHDDGRQRKSVPSWLRAALDDDEPRLGPGRRLTSTMPAPGRNEFPILHMSDEESIAYPSVSQTLGHGEGMHWNQQRGHGIRVDQGHRQHAHRGRRGHMHGRHARSHVGHGGQRRGGKRLQGHGHRNLHMHGPQRGHNRHGVRHDRMGHGHVHRVHHGAPQERVRQEDDIFLRRMVENDRLVHRNEKNIGGQFVGPGNANAKRRVIPEQPSSVQFPEHSRWDDNESALPEYGGPNNVIEKYLNS